MKIVYTCFEISSRCNMNCEFCFSDWRSNRKQISTEKAKHVIDVLIDNGLKAINLTGGDPLVRDDIIEIIKYCKDKGLMTIISTNGILLPQKYDFKYYDEKYWENLLNFNTKYELEKIGKPKLDLKILEFINKSKIPCVIFSTTTHTFIDFELGKYQSLFKACISTLEDFHIAGKPAIAFTKLASKFNIKPQEILHIGDNFEMDIKNPQISGCKTLLYEDDLYKKITKFLLKRDENDYSS